MSSKYVRNERARLQRRATTQGAQADPAPHHPLLQLQRQVGNAQVSRMLQRAQEEDELMASREAVQRAQEEDELQASREAVQRAQEEDELMASRGGQEVGLAGGPVSGETTQAINSARGGGSPLGSDMLNRMQEGLGADLSDVRVHTSTESASLNRKIGAKAFTTGSDVFLGAGASAHDTNLMAHELTHVVQQRSMSSGGPMRVTPAGDQHEQEAERTAAIVANGGTIAPKRAEHE